MNDEKRKISTTTDGQPARPGWEEAGAPAPIKSNGQHEAYWVLSEEERSKGFVRPVRDRYLHVGKRPQHPTRELTINEKERFNGVGYVVFEPYPEGSRAIGRYWTDAELHSGCGSETIMGRALAETYARQPNYYGSTFCCKCADHLPVGIDGEFIWLDGQRVGT